MELGDIEDVRINRNQDFVRTRMRYQDIISVEDQLKWFNGLSDINDWYFIATHNEKKIGLFHVKDINWKDKSGTSGGFIWNRSLKGSFEPGLAILALMDFAFFELRLTHLKAHYHEDFKEIVRLNEQLGYKIVDKAENGYSIAMVDKKAYLAKATQFRETALQLMGRKRALSDPHGLIDKIRNQDI